MYARLVLARAATIAIRYNAVRRQFGDKDAPIYVHGGILETQTLDYTMVFYNLSQPDISGAISTLASHSSIICTSLHRY
jgi:hypothetical protein